MTDENIKRLLPAAGWISLVAGIGYLAYVSYALVIGQVTVSSRSVGPTTIPLSSGWPFFAALSLYLAGGVFFLLAAKALIRPRRI